MESKLRLGDTDADRTEGYQIKSTRSAFDFRRVSCTVWRLSVPCSKANSFGYNKHCKDFVLYRIGLVLFLIDLLL